MMMNLEVQESSTRIGLSRIVVQQERSISTALNLQKVINFIKKAC